MNWNLAAHQTAELGADSGLLAAALEMSALLQVESVYAGRVRVRTRGVVGTMVTGPLKVTVHPRHLSQAVTLGLVLGGRGLNLQAVTGEQVDNTDLLRVLALAFLEETRGLFQRGLRREYRDVSARPDPLRGELDLDRWHGPKSPEGGMPWCSVRERTADLPEHRLLRAALVSLARAEVLESPLRQRAAALSERLADVPAVAPSRSSWPKLRRTGLFSAYAAPLDLAVVLLDGLLGEGEEDDGRSFLLDLDRVFERWLAAELKTLVPEGWRVEAQESALIASPRLQRWLDVAIWDDQDRRVAILDAKNKGLDESAPPRDDVHQMVSYLATQRCRLGLLVGIQKGSAPAQSEYRLSGDLGRLLVVRLPGRGTMEEMRVALEERAVTGGLASGIAK